MSKGFTHTEYKRSMRRRQAQKAIGVKPPDEPNYDVECDNCSCTPTVGSTGLCGPCCFGEADTVDGNW